MKIQKVFKDGVFLRDIYPHANWFQVKWFRFGQFVVRVTKAIIYWTKLGVTVSVAMIVGAFIFGNFTGVSTLIVNASGGDVDRLPMKIEQMKNDLVDEIAKKENNTNIPIVIDDNKAGTLAKKDKVSIGCMQFKISTVQHYSQILNKETLSDNEAVLLALDCEKAKVLAKDVIFKTQGGLWNWSVATKEMGAKVEVIKDLMK